MQKRLKICPQCSQVPQTLFYLSCQHQVCVDCAKSLAEKKLNQYFLSCPICEDQTCFDDNLYSRLTSQKSKPAKQQGRKIKKNQINQFQRHSEFIQKEDDPFQRYCSDHSQYTVLYVCKTCKNKIVCPQCVINGIHKTHEVLTIQKEGQLIKQKINRQLKTLNNKIQELKSIQTKRISTLKCRISELQELKNLAKEQYAHIRESLNREETAVLSKCNQLLLIHSTEQDSFKSQISKEIKNYEDMRNSILSVLNPLIKQGIIQSYKGFQKISIINLISQYNKLNFQQQISRQISKSFQNQAEMEKNIHNIINRIQKLKASGFYDSNKENRLNVRKSNLGKVEMQHEYVQIKPQFMKKEIKCHQRQKVNSNSYFNLY